MDNVQLISSNQELTTNLAQRFGDALVHTESIENAIVYAASGNIGTTIIEGYEKISTLEKIVTVLRDASPSMAITCIVKSDNVRSVMNSELKPYIYRVLPKNISTGQIVLAVNASQQEHKVLQKRYASGENLTVELRRDAALGTLMRAPSQSFWLTITGSLICVSLLTGLAFIHNSNGPAYEIPDNHVKSTVERLSPNNDSNVTAATLPQETAEPVLSMDMAMIEFVPEPPANTITSMLNKANHALLNDQLVNPYGDNAVAYFQQVLTIEQHNIAALEGLEEIQTRLVKRIETALLANNKRQASIDIVTLRSLYPQHSKLAELSTRLIRSELPVTDNKKAPSQNISTPKPVVRSRRDVTAEQSIELPTIQEQVNNILRRIDEHLEAKNFDAAISTLNSRTPAISAYDKLFEQRLTRIRNVLLRSGNIAIDQQDLLTANESIRLLERLNLSSEVESLHQRLNTTAQRARKDILIPASPIKVTPPRYPKFALNREIEGFVELQFIVRSNGDIDDIQVIESSHSKIFDAAAINAVANSSYEAATRNGIPEDQTVQQKLSFNLSNN